MSEEQYVSRNYSREYADGKYKLMRLWDFIYWLEEGDYLDEPVKDLLIKFEKHENEQMEKQEPNVKECDATAADSSNDPDKQSPQ
jgi:hypothetical protein